MKIEQGMQFQTKEGAVFEVIEAHPFGQLHLGQRKIVSETFRPVVRSWGNTTRSISEQVARGDLVAI